MSLADVQKYDANMRDDGVFTVPKVTSSMEKLEPNKGVRNQEETFARHPIGPLPPQRLSNAGAPSSRKHQVEENQKRREPTKGTNETVNKDKMKQHKKTKRQQGNTR